MKKTVLAFFFLLAGGASAAIEASPVIPYFTAEAVRSLNQQNVRQEGNALLQELNRELPGYEKVADGKVVLQRRLELLRRGMAQLKRNLVAQHSPELICYAAVSTEELRGFRDYFREVLTRGARPSPPSK